MKQRFLLIMMAFLMIAAQSEVCAQGRKNGQKERLTAEQRIDKQADFIAHSLMLNEDTEEKFCVLYTNYLKDLRECAFMDFRSEFGMDKVDKEKMTDEQIDKIIRLRFAKCQKILDVRERYYGEFKKILNPRQIMKMYSIERNVRKKVQGEMDRRCKQGNKNN